MKRIVILGLALAAACAPAGTPSPAAAGGDPLAGVAERYTRLVLALGQHDPDYVDAYYGPPAWREEEAAAKRPLAAIQSEADSLLRVLPVLAPRGGDEMLALRHRYLTRQLESLRARTAMLGGERLSFQDEARALYDAEVPRVPEQEFRQVLARLDELLPGTDPLPQRVQRYRDQFVIPRERLDTVFRTAVAEARRRTLRHVRLPENESFTIEYVTGKSWSGYNWYQGNARSLIQVNTDFPIFIDRALDLAAHEGYPGHHVYNALLEQHLVRERNWPEFSVYPLFSPQSLIAEGSANFGIEVAFPGAERLAFERDVLFPLAGLDPSKAAQYAEVRDLIGRLGYSDNEVARRYLDGEITREQGMAWLQEFALTPPERAGQRMGFIDQYRSYVINYNLGRDMVRRFVEMRGGTADHPERRWEVFSELLSSPRLPSGLQ
ncbi:hypothetical protein [Longimicrobium sp.]|uniref:hypothetical protein n=1 Tax=Longimicrobium sp. TaxID=2029185 RepID=UPI002E330295|nr:hypothetical protein [Longimicrobium sp.]HEX6039287.1 hypothetical protein [Longimicrobium sp.]